MQRRRGRIRKPPQEAVTARITSLSHEGRGVGNNDGKVMFVDGALPGEVVTARYVRQRAQLDELRVESVIEAAPERVEPVCEYAGTCGGCSLMHMDSHAQITFKQDVLLEHLQRETGLEKSQIPLLPILQAGTEHYRRKARLAVRIVAKKGGALVGFREKYSTFITDMDNCQVLVADLARLIAPLRTMLTSLHAGQQIPQIEVAVGEVDEGLRVALIFRHLIALTTDDQEILRRFGEQWACEIYLQPGKPQSVHKLYPAEGPDRLYYRLPNHELTFAFHPMDFTQINADINRLIVDQALELLDLNADDEVLDLFCGLGNFTLPLARHSKRVVGIEGSADMVERGGENARLNQLSNVEFHEANLFDSMKDKPWLQSGFTKVVLDPPRSGAIEIMPDLVALRPARIVYISCNPATLARDAAQLLAGGYRLKSAGVMDMFPHTAHVESMAVFEPNV